MNDVNYKRVSLKIGGDLHSEVSKLAADSGESLSAWIIKAIEARVQHSKRSSTEELLRRLYAEGRRHDGAHTTVAEEHDHERILRKRLKVLAEAIYHVDKLPFDEAYCYADLLLRSTCYFCGGSGCGECEDQPDQYRTPAENILINLEYTR